MALCGSQERNSLTLSSAASGGGPGLVSRLELSPGPRVGSERGGAGLACGPADCPWSFVGADWPTAKGNAASTATTRKHFHITAILRQRNALARQSCQRKKPLNHEDQRPVGPT